MAPLSLQDFIAKYNGVANTGDTPQNKGQCVGLIEMWIDNFGLPHDWGNAKDLLNDADPNAFDIIKNSPTNFPLPGDIIVFDETWGNGVGHTGICVTADQNSFDMFEQNNPEGSSPHVLHHDHYVDANNKGVIGWLHLKTIPVTTTLPANYAQIVHGSTQWDKTVTKYIPNADPTQTDFEALQSVIGGIQSVGTACASNLTKAQQDLVTATTQVQNVSEKLALEQSQRQDDAKAFTAQIDALKSTQPNSDKLIQEYTSQIKDLQDQVKQAINDKHDLAIKLAVAVSGQQPQYMPLGKFFLSLANLFKIKA